jgi:hypothetical protein
VAGPSAPHRDFLAGHGTRVYRTVIGPPDLPGGGTLFALLPAQDTDLVLMRMDPALEGFGGFAAAEIHRAAEPSPLAKPVTVSWSLRATGSALAKPQSYAIAVDPMTLEIAITGPDAVEVMYGGGGTQPSQRSLHGFP